MIDTNRILPFLITLLVQGTFLNYVLKLERIKCICSEDNRRDIIKYYSGLLIVMGVLMIVVPKNLPILKQYVLPLIGLLNIVYLVVVVSYVRNLVNKKCECSGTWERDVMYAYSLMLMAVVALFLVSIVGSMIIIRL